MKMRRNGKRKGNRKATALLAERSEMSSLGVRI
jgi:hypothetical protein